MLDTELFKVIIFCLKLMSADATQVEMDMVHNYKTVASFTYVKASGTVQVASQGKFDDFMQIKALDNGLYDIKFRSESSFQADLAPWLTKLDLKKITTREQIIKKDGKPWLKITASSQNVYVIIEESSQVFVLPKKYFKDK